MIEFFTVLMIDYEMASFNAAPLASIVYASESHCQQVMDQGLADPIYDHIVKLYGGDMMLTCEVSDVLSFILKPKLRPKEQNNG